MPAKSFDPNTFPSRGTTRQQHDEDMHAKLVKTMQQQAIAEERRAMRAYGVDEKAEELLGQIAHQYTLHKDHPLCYSGLDGEPAVNLVDVYIYTMKIAQRDMGIDPSSIDRYGRNPDERDLEFSSDEEVESFSDLLEKKQRQIARVRARRQQKKFNSNLQESAKLACYKSKRPTGPYPAYHSPPLAPEEHACYPESDLNTHDTQFGLEDELEEKMMNLEIKQNNPECEMTRVGISSVDDHIDKKADILKMSDIRPDQRPYCLVCSQRLIKNDYAARTDYGNVHVKCFECCECSTSLEHSEFYFSTSEKKFYCYYDFHKLFSPSCYYCHSAVEKEQIIALNRYYHPGHFFCCDCSKPFGQDDIYIQAPQPNSEILARCLDCDATKEHAKCWKCSHACKGEERFIEAIDRQWCQACFSCEICLNQLQGDFILRADGVLSCEKCEIQRLKTEAWHANDVDDESDDSLN